MKSVAPFDPSPFTLEQPFTRAASPYDYVIIDIVFARLTCLCTGIP